MTNERDSASTGGRFRLPEIGKTPGSAFFWRCDEQGWDHPPLFLPSPVLVLRVNRYGTRVETPTGEVIAKHDDISVTPFRWIDEILAAFTAAGHGTDRRLFMRPVFPLATVAASYEFGRVFNPHEGCFPHASRAMVDDLLVAFHCTGFARIDHRWRLVGRPPGRHARWRDWTLPTDGSEWPKPPLAPPDDMWRTRLVASTMTPNAEPSSSLTRDEYAEAVARIRRHLIAGDVYQANLTARFDTESPGTAEQIFTAGLLNGGERFAALMRAPGATHISFSPELFLRRWGRSISTRPIKGTRARDLTRGDEAVSQELLASAKDRAEHVMIVDLERNDMGRLCEYGSVRVESMMTPTVHPRVIHLESTVQGTLRSHVSFRELMSALFPGGSVTGAPKKRAMEIIGSVEPCPRGLYCGAVGWLDARGDMDLNLPIRTATLFDSGIMHMHAGGGIVADSSADEEWNEVLVKLDFMNRAVRQVGGGGE